MKNGQGSMAHAPRIGDPSSDVVTVSVDAALTLGPMRNLQGAAGMPAPSSAGEAIPDLARHWSEARVGLVRTYDWVSRLDTIDNPNSLFPEWAADPDDPASYNFDSTDDWVRQVQALGADVLFTIASAVPSNKRPPADLAKYEHVVENIVRHYVGGWGGGGFVDAVARWEFGDQPDFGRLHFDGSPDEFYAMYAAVSRAVKRVSPALQVGGPCPAFPLDEGPYRDGFLEFVRRNSLPLDFFTWMWFTDDSRDPADFRTVGGEVRRLLDSYGFEGAELYLVYWSMTGIPNASFDDADAAAFQAAAAVYMQDSAIDRAVFFRADAGIDLHYKIDDAAGIFEDDGSENARTRAFGLVGRALSASERIDATGGDDHGFAVLAGRSESADAVRVLISNYAIPEEFLVARERDVFEFQIPIDSIRATMSFVVPPRRSSARSAGHSRYSLEVSNLPWAAPTCTIVRQWADGKRQEDVIHSDVRGSVTIVGQLAAPGVELIEITRGMSAS